MTRLGVTTSALYYDGLTHSYGLGSVASAKLAPQHMVYSSPNYFLSQYPKSITIRDLTNGISKTVWTSTTDKVTGLAINDKYVAYGLSVGVSPDINSNVYLYDIATKETISLETMVGAAGAVGEYISIYGDTVYYTKYDSTNLLDIWACDVTGYDVSAPEIEHEYIDFAKKNPIPITANVSDAEGVDSVILYYKNVGETTYEATTMNFYAGNEFDGSYQGTIPAQTGLGYVVYYIEAVDINDNIDSTIPHRLSITEVGEPPEDSDGDGLPDDWEEEYFGNLDETANGDYDDDGFTNEEEYDGGTDPTDPDDYPDGEPEPKPEPDPNTFTFTTPMIVAIAVVVTLVGIGAYIYMKDKKRAHRR